MYLLVASACSSVNILYSYYTFHAVFEYNALNRINFNYFSELNEQNVLNTF